MKEEKDWAQFDDSMRLLLLDNQIAFAALWVKENDDLILRGYAEDGPGAILCGVFQEWLNENMSRMMVEIDEKISVRAAALNLRVGPAEEPGTGVPPQTGG